MRSQVANLFMLMFVWTAVTGCPAMLYSQEVPLPPPAQERSVTPRPVDQPEPKTKSAREIIASVGKTLRAVEASERETRRQAREWFAIEEALSDVLKTLETDRQLAPGLEVEFAKSVLTALLPDDEEDKLVLAARDDVIAFLKESSKKAERVSSSTKHKWLDVSARFKRLSAAARTVESLRVYERDGSITFNLLSEAEQRLLDAETEFANSAFAMFPIDRVNKAAVQRVEHALQLVKQKHIQESWAAALETWRFLNALREAGVENATIEAAAREMVYFYEAKWHEAKAR